MSEPAAGRLHRWRPYLAGGPWPEMAALERTEGAAAVVLSIKASPPTYRGIVSDLSEALIHSWWLDTSRAVRPVLDDLISAPPGRAIAESRRAVSRLAAEIAASGRAMDEEEGRDLAEALAAAYLLGQSEVLGPLGWAADFGLPDQDAIAGLQRSGLFWIGEHYGKAIDEDGLRADVEAMIRSGVGRVEGGRLLRARFGQEFERSHSYWRGLAATVATRARSFGALSGMEAVGVTHYRYVNPDDERTSDVCRYLSGTTFSISDGVALRDRLLTARTPDEWRSLSPWPRPRDLEGRTPAELAAAGIAWPPLHFHCRSALDVEVVRAVIPEDYGPIADLHRQPKPKRAAKPKKPKAPDRHAVIMHTRTGGQAGSNRGGFYTGSDGVRRYVKLYDDPAQAACEHVANAIYRDLRLAAPRSELFRLPDGGLGYASEILDNAGTLADSVDAATAREALRGFAADVLLGNWDAAGMSGDNMVRIADGVARIDTGGSLLFRAMAGRKPAAQLTTRSPEDWWRLIDDANPGYSKIARAAGVTRAVDLDTMEAQIKAIEALAARRGGWARYVEGLEGLTEGERGQIVGMLEARTAFLAKKRADVAALRAIDGYERKNKWATNQNSKAGATRAGATRVRWRAELDYKGIDAIRTYTGSGYSDMNGLLRGTVNTATARTYYAARNERLREVLTASAIPEDTVVYRGASAEVVRAMVDAGGGRAAEGGLYTDKGFTSTSIYRPFSEGWASAGPNSVLFRILLPKGSAAAYVDDISSNKGEMEMLLRPGVRLRICRSEYDTTRRRWLVDARMLDDTEVDE